MSEFQQLNCKKSCKTKLVLRQVFEEKKRGWGWGGGGGGGLQKPGQPLGLVRGQASKHAALLPHIGVAVCTTWVSWDTSCCCVSQSCYPLLTKFLDLKFIFDPLYSLDETSFEKAASFLRVCSD